jgi:hypothetical protein
VDGAGHDLIPKKGDTNLLARIANEFQMFVQK